jgi:hydrogenase maturation protease
VLVPVCVIGVGTPNGDDAAGLRVAESLAKAGLPEGVRVMTCERGADLLEALGKARVAVIVDALRSGSAPGTVRRISAEALGPGSGLSTHALGVSEALSLAQALGRAPERIEVVGIEAGEAGYEQISAQVASGVEVAAAVVRALVDELAGRARRS